MLKIRYRNSVYLKLLVSTCNLRGRRPLTMWFCSGIRKENVPTSILNIPTTATFPFWRVYSGYDAKGLKLFIVKLVCYHRDSPLTPSRVLPTLRYSVTPILNSRNEDPTNSRMMSDQGPIVQQLRRGPVGERSRIRSILSFPPEIQNTHLINTIRTSRRLLVRCKWFVANHLIRYFCKYCKIDWH